MDHQFELELDDLQQKVLRMAKLAENAVGQSVRALVERDSNLAERVLIEDEPLDHFEMEIDEMIIMLLTKAPLASDLRLIPVAMKISQNLERIGDEATKISKRARDLSKEPAIRIDFDINRLTTATIEMLRNAVEVFAKRDCAAARDIIPRDKEVDGLNKEIHGQLARQMTGFPETVERCLHWMVAVKSLERIADHAKNIAEEVVYLCEAQDIRHSLKS